MIPPLAARLEAWMSRFASRAGVAKGSGDGFWSGTAVGASLGLVYAPCAGPILAGVITVSASQSFSAGRLAVALSYGIGSAVVLYFLMLGGRRVIAPLARRGVGLQIAMGAVMVVVALAMLGNYDIRFQNHDRRRPAELPRQPDARASRTPPRPKTRSPTSAAAAHGVGSRSDRRGAGNRAPRAGSTCRCSARRRNSSTTSSWFNTPGDRPLTLSGAARPGRPGRLLDLQLHQLHPHPALPEGLGRASYRKDGLTIVGVHTPEFPFEREASNVEAAIDDNGIRYPVAQDNEQATWNAYGNQYWPAEYFIDAQGSVRYVHFGEGEYGEKEKVIRELLAEAGQDGQRQARPRSTRSRHRRR